MSAEQEASARDIFFAHKTLRPIQEEMVKAITKQMKTNGNAVIHAPTGLGKCVGRNTLILTENGLERIEDIYLKKIRTNSLNKSLKIEIKKGEIIKKKKSQLFRVTTRTGREIEVTDDHKFFSIEKGKAKWRKLEDLTGNDFIACPTRLDIIEEKAVFTLDMLAAVDNKYTKDLLINTNIPLEKELESLKKEKRLTNEKLAKLLNISIHKLKHIKNKKLFKIKEALRIIKLAKKEPNQYRLAKIGSSGRKEIFVPEINDQFAYFVGMIIGNGFIDSGSRKAINLSNKDKEAVKEFREFAKSVNSTVLKKTGSDRDHFFYNKPLTSLMYSIGFPLRKKTESVSIPKIFFKQKRLLANVLSGIYDTDGSIYDNTTLELITKSKSLKESVLHALLVFGINPIVKSKRVNKKEYFRIYICDSQNNKQFKEKIGFKIAYKRKRLECATNKKQNTNINVIPKISSTIKQCKENLKIPYSREREFKIYESYAYNKRNPSKKGLKKLINYFKKKSKKECEQLDLLTKLADSDIFWDKIADIKKTKKEYVYDASIPETENFVGNGIILHNTAASIAPAITYALEKNKTVFFLTSKNTQHKIAVETLQGMKKRHQKDIIATDIVGKKWMCIQPGISTLSTNEFNEYCRALREDKRCEFYENFKKGEALTPQAKLALEQAKQTGPLVVEEIIALAREHAVCPYELALVLGKQSNIVIADYYYLFHPRIRENFLKRIDKELSDSIIIIDEGHNLPFRIKDLATENCSTILLKRAITESKKFNYDQLRRIFESVFSLFATLINEDQEERYISREEFVRHMEEITSYHEFMNECYNVADYVREEQKTSAIGSFAAFLDGWMGEDKGFTRIVSRKKGIQEDIIQVSYRCLDPSIIAKEIIQQSHNTFLMSGTLTPTSMYVELLGFPPSSTLQETYPSPFPEENRLNLIVAKTSTKFTTRSPEQYRQIAQVITDIINDTPGNSAVFFPSYVIKEAVDTYLTKVEKTVFHERQEMSKQEKDEMINTFRSYKNSGAALLAVVSGSYGEGIDLPGDELKTVIVVGLPLTKPDLETEALIKYYDEKFKRGWDYGYLFPAFNKIIQNAGRCIRSATDRGVIVFLDERFTWPRYYRCFPESWKIKVSVDRYGEKIRKFFAKES